MQAGRPGACWPVSFSNTSTQPVFLSRQQVRLCCDISQTPHFFLGQHQGLAVFAAVEPPGVVQAHDFGICAAQGHSPELRHPVHLDSVASTKDNTTVWMRVRKLLAKSARELIATVPLRHVDFSYTFLSDHVPLVNEPRVMRGMRLKTATACSLQAFAFITLPVTKCEFYLWRSVEISVKPVSPCRRCPPMRQ